MNFPILLTYHPILHFINDFESYSIERNENCNF